MILVTTSHGPSFVGRNRADVVRQMRDDAWLQGTGKGDYMDSVAERVSQQTGRRPRTTVDGFIEDLQELGYLREELLN
jgi:hypothetical protein